MIMKSREFHDPSHPRRFCSKFTRFFEMKRRALKISFLLALIWALGCHTGGDEISADRYDVGVRTLTLIDETRETPPCLSYPGSRERRLITEVWYPIRYRQDILIEEERDAPADRSGGPYPLVIWSHGFMGRRNKTTYLSMELVRRGYVVAAPDYPHTSLGSPCISWPSDGSKQGLDVRFLVDSLLDLSSRPDYFLTDMIDAERIGVAGYSYGGFTSILAGYSASLGDQRIKAVLALAPFACLFDEHLFDQRSVPLMIMAGDRDGLAVFESNAEHPYQLAPSPKYLVRIHGGNHTGFAGIKGLTFDPKIGALIRLAGMDPSDPGSISPDDLPPGPMRELAASFFDMVEDVDGSMEGCDFSLLGPLLINNPAADRQCDLALLFGTTFLDLYLKGIPDSSGVLTPEFAESAASDLDLGVTMEREIE